MASTNAGAAGSPASASSSNVSLPLTAKSYRTGRIRPTLRRGRVARVYDRTRARADQAAHRKHGQGGARQRVVADYLLLKADEQALLDYLATLTAKEYVVYNNPRAASPDLAEEMVRMLVRVRRHLPRKT